MLGPSGNASEAERLKQEGNDFFRQNDFAKAYQKYTEALEHDDKNAVLYCNRAACSLNLHRYLNASIDARKATELDPKYAKGWGRAAKASMCQNKPDIAVDYWKRAIELFPDENLTPAEAKLKDQYVAALAVTQDKLSKLEAAWILPWREREQTDPAQLPWNLARALLPELEANREWNSGAWVILYAYQEWEAAVEAMKQARVVNSPAGMTYMGQAGVIKRLTDAILADPRVFHDPSVSFQEGYNKQIITEGSQFLSWLEHGPRGLIAEASKRLETERWASIDPALSITIRGWIMSGIMQDRLKGETESALDYYTSALEVLQWGADLKDVPNEGKGGTFQPVFVRGVKCLRLEAATKLCAHPKGNIKVPLHEILAGADELLDDIGTPPAEPSGTSDAAYFLLCYRYPAGHAHAFRGFYYHRTGRELRAKDGITSEVEELYDQAGKEYYRAAFMFPKDDEWNAYYMYCALNIMQDIGAPVFLLLHLSGCLRDAAICLKRIWAFKANIGTAKDRDENFQSSLRLREKYLELIASGVIQNPESTMFRRSHEGPGPEGPPDGQLWVKLE